MTECTRSYPQCKCEFRVTDKMKNDAFHCAEQYTKSKAPYGIPTYPYVWEVSREHDTINLEMGRDDQGRRKVAQFKFDVDVKPGVNVHVVVWFILDSEPDQEGWTARFSADERLHAAAVVQFRGILLKAPGTFSLEVPTVDPPPVDEEENLPPLPQQHPKDESVS